MTGLNDSDVIFDKQCKIKLNRFFLMPPTVNIYLPKLRIYGGSWKVGGQASLGVNQDIHLFPMFTSLESKELNIS